MNGSSFLIVVEEACANFSAYCATVVIALIPSSVHHLRYARRTTSSAGFPSMS
jgi:hypothetical protein